MPRRADAYRGLAQISRLKVLDVVQATPGVGLAELTASTGLHENTLRDHMRVLETEGFVRTEVEHRGTRGRPRTVFHPVLSETESDAARRRIESAAHHGDLLRKIRPDAEVSSLGPDALHQIDALYEHLDDVGLDPLLDEDGLTVELIPCPFHDLIEEGREIACRVHEGLIRNILTQADGPVELERLLPFTTAHTCHVHLQVRESASEPSPE